MADKIVTKDQVSAGGVAFHQDGETLQTVIVSVKPSLRWQLPKGIVDPGETPEITAVREVRKEAGVEPSPSDDRYGQSGTARAYGNGSIPKLCFHLAVPFGMCDLTLNPNTG